jgi:hypothetical protein
MNLPRRLALLCLLTLAAPAHASAADAPAGAVKLAPATAGSASELQVDIGQEALNQGNGGGERARSLSLFGTRGLKFDPRSVVDRCSDSRADAFDCPAASRIGSGSAQGRAEGALVPGGGMDFTASIDVFLAAPRQTGDVAGVVVQVSEPQSGQRFNGKGRIVPVGSGPFGSETRFDGLSGDGGQLPPGVTVTLKRVQLRIGAKRTVKRKVTVRRNGKRRRAVKRVRYSLLTNPRTCTGSWPYRLRVEYPSRTDDFDGGIACSAR